MVTIKVLDTAAEKPEWSDLPAMDMGVPFGQLAQQPDLQTTQSGKAINSLSTGPEDRARPAAAPRV